MILGIELRGMDSLISKLNALADNVDECVYKGVGKGVSVIEGDAKDLCPVDHGELKGSINSKVEKTSSGIKGSVGTNKEYAAYVEFGTGQRGSESPSPPKKDIGDGYREDWMGMPAQPYLYPALMKNKDTVAELCVKEISSEIRRIGRSKSTPKS